jgi:hypothetical protein
LHGAVLPTVLDVTVETPDYTLLTLKVRTPYLLASCMDFRGSPDMHACICYARLSLQTKLAIYYSLRFFLFVAG